MKTTVILMVLVVFFLQGCVETNQNSSTTGVLLNNEGAVSSVEKIEVYHFHATHQCYSCKTVGQYAEDTVNTYFANELKEGKITFASINIDLVENAELVSKYGPTGSSLWIGVYDRNGFHKEENVNVWYKINDKQQYMDYLKKVIEEKLIGK